MILSDYYQTTFKMEDRAIERLTDLYEYWMPYVDSTATYPVDCVYTDRSSSRPARTGESPAAALSRSSALSHTGVVKETQPDGSSREVQTQCIAVGDGLDYEKYPGIPTSYRSGRCWKPGSFRTAR